MVVGIHQPNYMPWLGFFNKMAQCDVFIFLDDVDISLGGAKAITHRARVMGSNGPVQLSIPLRRNSGPAIRDVLIAPDDRWSTKHERTLDAGYGGAAHYASVAPFIHEALGSAPSTLVSLTVSLIESIKGVLGLNCRTLLSSDLGLPQGDPSERLAAQCLAVGGTTYLSGRGARSYNDPAVFERRGVELRYSSFEHPVYEQGNHPFTPGLSVVDALAWQGRNPVRAMLGLGS